MPAATLLKQLPGLEASSVACVRTYRCTGRVDGCSGRCDLLLTREARFDSAPHWPAIRLSRVRLSVVCVRRSRERGLDSRGVRRWARARRQIISRFVAHGDGGEQCGPRSVRRRDLPFWPRAELMWQRYQKNNNYQTVLLLCVSYRGQMDRLFVVVGWSICSVCLIGGRWTVCWLLLGGPFALCVL